MAFSYQFRKNRDFKNYPKINMLQNWFQRIDPTALEGLTQFGEGLPSTTKWDIQHIVMQMSRGYLILDIYRPVGFFSVL
jgi:hypothetical protein